MNRLERIYTAIIGLVNFQESLQTELSEELATSAEAREASQTRVHQRSFRRSNMVRSWLS